MRKYLRYANLIILAAGAVGMLLMHWLFASGTDERGLYPANHPAWILVGILTTAVMIGAWLLVRQAGINRNYRQNFPASILAALGCVAAAVGLASAGIRALETGKLLGLAGCLVGVLGAVGMLWAAVCRFLGKRSQLPVHSFPCFFFALQLFLLGQEFGAEPEMCRYLYRFWAAVAMIPACYYLWGFEVNLGKRSACLFWCLVAGYCNLVAIAGNPQWLLHGCMAVWLLTALPRLQYLPKQPRSVQEPAVQPAPAPESQPEAAALPATDLQTPEVLPQNADTLFTENAHSVNDPLAVDLPDPDAIIKQLLRDFGQQENP